MRYLYIINLLAISFSLLATDLNIKVNISVFENNSDLRRDMRKYQKDLAAALNQMEWDLYEIDDYKSMTIQLKAGIKSSNDESYSGTIDVVAGVDAPKDRFMTIRFKKDIKFQETNSKFIISNSLSPDMEIDNYDRLERIFQYYVYLAIMELYDRLSFVDKPDFILLGDRYENQLDIFTSAVSEELKTGSWSDRIKFYKNLKEPNHITYRRLNSLIFNARDLYNNGGEFRKRSKYYLPHILKMLEKLEQKSRNKIFSTYYYDFGELFAKTGDSGLMDKLIEMDKAHKAHYERKK